MDVSILPFRSQREVEALMREIGVEPGGVEIMSPKSVNILTRVNQLPIFAANILKQETLSLGADTAVSKHALTGKTKYTDCLIIANLAHYERLCEKLKRQPYGLSQIGARLKSILSNYQKDDFVWNAGKYKLDLKTHTHIMGIVNITPDSFSGDGLVGNTPRLRSGQAGYGKRPACSPRGARLAAEPREAEGRSGRPACRSGRDTDIVEYAQKLADEGADILDIGGESSRPGAKPVSLKEELRRVVPVIKAIVKKVKIPLSVDTYKAEVARQALDNGANIINDITALGGGPGMAKVAAKYKAGLVLMHMRGKPASMQKNPRYASVMGEIGEYLNRATTKALENGIDGERIVLDPGIGFGKTSEHNLQIIKSLSRLKALGRPILVGLSRKSFLGKITHSELKERLSGSLSANCLAVVNGAKIVRVHDVKETRQALAVLDAILKCQ